MERIKKISAALLAMTMACGIMASCGNTDDESSKSEKEDTASTAAAEDKEGDAESEADADAESEGEDAAASGDLAEITPDPNYAHKYEFDGYDAFLMFADAEGWFWSNFNGEGEVHSPEFDESMYGFGVDADITGDGEYTVALTKDSIYQNNGYLNPQALINEDDGTIFGGNGVSVFCVDIIGLMDGSEVSGANEETGEWEHKAADEVKLTEGDNHYDVHAIGDYKPSDLKVEVTSIKVDGNEFTFDASKLRYGNIENENNRYRIEIYNSYGKTAEDPPFDPFSLTFAKSLEVTFTIEGLGEIKQFPEVEPFAAGNAGADAAESGAEDASAAEDAAADDAAAAE